MGNQNNQDENHLYVDCPGVGQVVRGLRTGTTNEPVCVENINLNAVREKHAKQHYLRLGPVQSATERIFLLRAGLES